MWLWPFQCKGAHADVYISEHDDPLISCSVHGQNLYYTHLYTWTQPTTSSYLYLQLSWQPKLRKSWPHPLNPLLYYEWWLVGWIPPPPWVKHDVYWKTGENIAIWNDLVFTHKCKISLWNLVYYGSDFLSRSFQMLTMIKWTFQLEMHHRLTFQIPVSSAAIKKHREIKWFHFYPKWWNINTKIVSALELSSYVTLN